MQNNYLENVFCDLFVLKEYHLRQRVLYRVGHLRRHQRRVGLVRVSARANSLGAVCMSVRRGSSWFTSGM